MTNLVTLAVDVSGALVMCERALGRLGIRCLLVHARTFIHLDIVYLCMTSKSAVDAASDAAFDDVVDVDAAAALIY